MRASAKRSPRSPPITAPTIAPVGVSDAFAAPDGVEAGATVGWVMEDTSIDVDEAVETLAKLDAEVVVGVMLEVDRVVDDGTLEAVVTEILPREVLIVRAVASVVVGGRAVTGQPPFGLHGSTAQHPEKVSPVRLQMYH